MSDAILIEQQGPVAHVILNRPDKHNGIDWAVFSGLVAVGRRLAKDRSLRAVILRGAGPSFCSGLDIKANMKDVRHAVQGFVQPSGPGTNIYQECCMVWRRVPVPVIAQIHGHCFGGGLQIALGADFRIASPGAQFAVMEVKYGLVPDMSGTVTLRELLPMDQIKLLAMTGEVINAEQALSMGLITRIADDPAAATQEIIGRLLTRSPDALAATKAMFQENWRATERSALANERRFQRKMFVSKNQKIAMKLGLGASEASFGPRRG